MEQGAATRDGVGLRKAFVATAAFLALILVAITAEGALSRANDHTLQQATTVLAAAAASIAAMAALWPMFAGHPSKSRSAVAGLRPVVVVAGEVGLVDLRVDGDGVSLRVVGGAGSAHVDRMRFVEAG